mmetsp:Transcript_95525/g.259269  ORF Transcript_95525/g.259269 Transcript_95525/m.259269 type:complete len:291 (+) Transcript_95525:60-932(+)
MGRKRHGPAETVQAADAPAAAGAGHAAPAGVLGLQAQVPGLPGIPGVAGLPGLSPLMAGMGRLPPALPGMPAQGMPPPASDKAAMDAWVFRQAAEAYDMARHAGIAPEVSEFSDHFGLDERATKALDDEMKKRRDTFDADMQALWIGLEGAKNPSGLLMLKLKDMRMGQFRGMSALDTKVQEFAKQYRLDAQAAVKLAEVLDKRDDPENDMARIGKHLERSNKPSSLMMMLLRDLRDGKPVKDPEFHAAVGSRVHEKELKKADRERSRSRRGRSGGRQQQRERSRGRGRR